MAIGDIETATYPISVDADGVAVVPSVAIIAGWIPTDYDSITSQIVNVTGKNGVYKTVVVVTARRIT